MAFIKFVTLCIAAIAVVIAYLYNRHWSHERTLTAQDFRAANYTVLEIPTTYYEAGKLSNVLKAWDHSFHLYRLKEGEKFHFDHRNIKSTVRSKSLKENCPWESTLCTPCFDDKKKVTNINAQQIFDEPGWYASFAKISDDVVTQLWDLLRLPFNVQDTEIEHAFISNLAAPMITAAIHANPMTSSMAVQFVGSKTWLFFAPSTYIDQMGATPAAPILLPRHSPTGSFTVYAYRSRPGDVLFFTESWAHIVDTHAGPNVMVNYRHFHISNILRQPLTWIHAALNMKLFPKLTHEAGKVGGGEIQDQSVPEKLLNYQTYMKINGACAGDTAEFDKQMLELIKSYR